MCYARPAKRCDDEVCKRYTANTERLSAAKREHEAAVRAVENCSPSDERYEELERARLRAFKHSVTVQNQYAQSRERYEATAEGTAAMRSQAQDPTLSAAKRAQLLQRANDLDEERKRYLNSARAQRRERAGISGYLTERGVPADRIAEITERTEMRLFLAPSATYLSRADRADHQARELVAEAQRAQAGKSPTERAQIAEDFAPLIAAALARKDAAQSRYLMTTEGLRDLRRQEKNEKSDIRHTRRAIRDYHDARRVVGESPEDAATKAALIQAEQDAVLALAKTQRRLRTSSMLHEKAATPNAQRALRDEAMREIASDYNLDFDAMKAAAQGRRRGRPPLSPEMKGATNSVVPYLTNDEMKQVEQAAAEQGMSTGEFIRTRALSRPREAWGKESVDQLHERFPKRPSDGTRHRPSTVQDKRRSASPRVHLSPVEKRQLQLIASSHGTSVSSYVRSMTLGLDPRAVSDDRSQKSNDAKRARVRQMEQSDG